MIGIRIVAVVALLATSATGQFLPREFWFTKGGAVGETVEFQVRSGSNPTASIVAAGLHYSGSGFLTPPFIALQPGPFGYSIPIPNVAALAGVRIYIQQASFAGTMWYPEPAQPLTIAASNAATVDPPHGHAPRINGQPVFGTRPTVLADGRVLLSGGAIAQYRVTVPTAIARIYDPAQRQMRTIASLNAARIGHTTTLLRDGTVLITGGNQPPTAELFDPVSETFTSLGSIPGIGRSTAKAVYDPRSGREYALLLDYSSVLPPTNLLYDASQRTFSTLGTMFRHRTRVTMTAMHGRVLITGGVSSATLPYADVFDVATRRFAPWGSMAVARSGHAAFALDARYVLIAGGLRSSNGSIPQSLDSIEIFDVIAQRGVRLPIRLNTQKTDCAIYRRTDGSLAVLGSANPLAPHVIEILDAPPRTLRPLTGRYPPYAWDASAGVACLITDNSLHVLR